jgi:hypothetical protein
LNFYTKSIYKIFNLTKESLLIAYLIKNLKNNFIENLKKIIRYKKKVKNITKNSIIIKQRIYIKISIKKIWANFSTKGFLHLKKSQPIINKYLCFYDSFTVINNYNYIMKGLLFYYRPIFNFSKIKNLVEKLRKSCILTLKTKHKKNLKWVFNIYSKNVKQLLFTNYFIKLPTFAEIFTINKGFYIYKTLKIYINKFIYKIIKKNLIFLKCCFFNCNNKNTKIHYFCEIKPFISIILLKIKPSTKIKNIYFIIFRKQLPICNKHYL